MKNNKYIIIFRASGPLKNTYLADKLAKLNYKVKNYPILAVKKIYTKKINIYNNDVVITTSFNSIYYLSKLTQNRIFDLYTLGKAATLLAKKLEDNGASAIMPLASPIGSGLGLQNKTNISLIIKQSKVPIIVDAGIGTPSDATIAMELGCDGVLINTAIAKAKKPILMAKAFKDAVVAGRNSFLAGRMKKNYFGSPSSPTEGII